MDNSWLLRATTEAWAVQPTCLATRARWAKATKKCMGAGWVRDEKGIQMVKFAAREGAGRAPRQES